MKTQNIIRQLRKELDITQEKLADLCNKTPTTVSRWENGISVPGKRAKIKLLELAEERNVSMSCLEDLKNIKRRTKDERRN